MDCRKGFRILFRGLFVALALSIAAGFTFFSSTIPIHAATTYSWPLIGPGSTGADVYSVQLMLQAHGYSLSADGVDGPQTTGAVIAFQSAHGLSADGVVGPLTWPVLVVTTRNGSTGSAVVADRKSVV